MVAARNMEGRIQGRERRADYTYTARASSGGRSYATTAKALRGEEGRAIALSPRFDSRHTGRYAQSLLANAGYWDVLDADARTRNDNARADTLTMAFARQLEYIFREPYEAIYPELKASQFIPFNTEVPPEKQTFTYRMLDRTGDAKIVNEASDDWPNVDLLAEEFQAPVVTIGAKYSYSILESMRAARDGIALDAWKATAARKAIEYFIEHLAAVGDANSGVVGLTNAPGINATSQVSSGGNWIQQIAEIGSATTDNATVPALVVAQAIGSDIAAGKRLIRTQSKGEIQADTVLVGYSAYAALESAPQTPAFNSKSLLQYLKELYDVDIECWPQLDTAGEIDTTYNGTTYSGRVMIYKKDPAYASLVLSQPFTQLPPQPHNMTWRVGCWARCGGVMMPQPLAYTYIDGVS